MVKLPGFLSEPITWKNPVMYIRPSLLPAVHSLVISDYGRAMAKSLILCGPNSNPNPK